MTFLVTGVAGFIGFHVAAALLSRGEAVVGVDNLNDYYDVGLKQARLAQLTAQPGFRFAHMNIADRDALPPLVAEVRPGAVIHLAAQAGVRYSLVNPYAYVEANLMGQVVLLEAVRALETPPHVVYASSSSVYGGNRKMPFSVDDRVDQPVSLYAATKRADELITHSYSHLFRIPATGLRFFTVYGPWGRPDMAPYLFARAIADQQPIRVFNHGRQMRDFTYIDDIVQGVLAAADRPPRDDGDAAPHRIYNLGGRRPEKLMDFIEALEKALGRSAEKILEAAQPGDVEATWADIDASARDLGFSPTVAIDEGVPRFIQWFKEYYGVA